MRVHPQQRVCRHQALPAQQTPAGLPKSSRTPSPWADENGMSHHQYMCWTLLTGTLLLAVGPNFRRPPLPRPDPDAALDGLRPESFGPRSSRCSKQIRIPFAGRVRRCLPDEPVARRGRGGLHPRHSVGATLWHALGMLNDASKPRLAKPQVMLCKPTMCPSVVSRSPIGTSRTAIWSRPEHGSAKRMI